MWTLKVGIASSWLSGFLKNDTRIVQAGYEAAAVDLAATAGAVAEANNVGGMLPQTDAKG
jgi:hypothetical protein